MNLSDLQDRIGYVVGKYLLRPASANAIRWANQEGPQPSVPFISLNILNRIRVGRDDSVQSNQNQKISFDAEIVAGQQIEGDIDGNPITPIPFSVDFENTLILLRKEIIKFDNIDSAMVLIDSNDLYYVSVDSSKAQSVVFNLSVTGGTPPNVSVTELIAPNIYELRGTRQLNVSFNSFGSGTLDDLYRFADAYDSDELLNYLHQVNLSLLSIPPTVTDISDVFGPERQERGLLEMTFYAPIRNVFDPGQIDTVNIGGKLVNPDDSEIITSQQVTIN
jgi:hypothetical protein